MAEQNTTDSDRDAQKSVLNRDQIESFLDLSDERGLELYPDPEFIDPNPPRDLTNRQWETLSRFADLIIPSYTAEAPKTVRDSTVQSIDGAGKRGFKQFCKHADAVFYNREKPYSSNTRRSNTFNRNLEKGAILLDKLAHRDYRMEFVRLPDRDGISCVANFALIEPELFDYLRARVIESYFFP